MPVASHELSVQSPEAVEERPATVAGARFARVGRVVRWLPRIVVNLLLVGLLGLLIGLMWAPGYIQANERSEREFRRPSSERRWWGRSNREGSPFPSRPDRGSQR